MRLVNKWIGEAVLFVLVMGEVGLARRLGMLRAASHGWLTCRYFTGVGASMLACLHLLEFGFAHLVSIAPLFLVGVGALAGDLTGLSVSFTARRTGGI